MKLKADNNNQHQQQNSALPTKTHRSKYLAVHVTIPVKVQVDINVDESDGSILYRDHEDENMSEGNYKISYLFYLLHSTLFVVFMNCSATGIPDSS